jgi:hypothetical protein
VSAWLRGLGRLLRVGTRSFDRALANPEAAQAAVRARVAAALAESGLGRADGVRGPQDWDRVPPRGYEALRAHAEAACRGEPHPLPLRQLRHVEWTSGSTGARKPIPVTALQQRSLTWMTTLWIADLLAHGPEISGGRTWIMTTPSLDGGDHDDTVWVSPWMRWALRPFLVEPVRGVTDPAAWLDAMAARLVTTADLAVISAWNPTLVSLLLDHIRTRRDAFARLAGDRAGALSGADDPAWGALWPKLAVISAWADGHAEPEAARLARRLPGVLLQPKGLLATEGPVTVPRLGAPGPVPLVDTVLVELIDHRGDILPLHRARVGEHYEVLPSWVGGFPRYRLGDRVEVVGRHRNTPALRFVGRADARSDLVGEKLDEDFARAAMRRVLPPDTWAVLVPETGRPHRYVLLTEEPVAPEVVEALERALREALHYDRARALGQLGPLGAEVRPGAALEMLTAHARGARLGDVKHRVFTAPRAG